MHHATVAKAARELGERRARARLPTQGRSRRGRTHCDDGAAVRQRGTERVGSGNYRRLLLQKAPEPVIKKSKAPRTEAQLKTLQLAREKANKVRQENAALKRKQQDIDRALLERAKKEQAERIKRRNKEITAPPAEDEAEPPKENKRKPARKVIVTEASSACDEEEEVEGGGLPKARKQPLTAEQIRYNRAFQKSV